MHQSFCNGYVSALLIPPIISANYDSGQMNQVELSLRVDNFIITPSGEIEHLHNQLIAAIYGNVTREMPDQGVASWVSANDKPTTGAGSKPVSGDAAEQRLKTEVMQLPARDRRRLKDLSQNDVSLKLSCSWTMYKRNTKERFCVVRSLQCAIRFVLRYPTTKNIPGVGGRSGCSECWRPQSNKK